jgi:hypothetical protein
MPSGTGNAKKNVSMRILLLFLMDAMGHQYSKYLELDCLLFVAVKITASC